MNPFISCDFTRLKAEDPFSYPLYYQAVTHIRETATFSYRRVNQLSASIILHSFTLNNPENIYHHTAPCAVLLFGRSASPYYCCLHKSLTNVTARPHEQPRYPVQRSRPVTLGKTCRQPLTVFCNLPLSLSGYSVV